MSKARLSALDCWAFGGVMGLLVGACVRAEDPLVLVALAGIGSIVFPLLWTVANE